MTDSEVTLQINLEELRRQVVRRLALLLAGAGAVGTWLLMPLRPFPAAEFWLIVVLMCLGIAILLLQEKRLTTARHLLVWGLTAGLATAMWQFSMVWVPFLGVPIIFVGAMLISRGELAVGGLIAAAAAWLTSVQVSTIPLPGLLGALALGVILAWITVRTLYTALEWAWTMQVRADELLETARDRQGELGRALRSAKLTSSSPPTSATSCAHH